MNRAVIMGLAIALGIVACPGTVCAYTGGPVRVTIAGFETREGKIFYRSVGHDESGEPPRVFYLTLDGPHPERSVRARSLEDPPYRLLNSGTSPAWRRLTRRLVPLPAERSMDMAVRMTSAPAPGSGLNGEPRMRMHVEITAAGRHGTADVDAWCQPLIGVQGAYGIPGRDERLVVLTYVGRDYGCEEVEIPVLLR